MITFTKGALLSGSFIPTWQKLNGCPKLEAKVAYNLMRLTKFVEKELAKLNKERAALLDKFCKPGEKPNSWKLKEDRTGFDFKEGIDNEAAQKEIEAFSAETVEINRDRFELDQFAQAGLSAQDLSLLEPIFNEPE